MCVCVLQVGSPILACAAVFEILMSIPLALTIWKIGMGQDNIDFLQLVMIFLILCSARTGCQRARAPRVLPLRLPRHLPIPSPVE